MKATEELGAEVGVSRACVELGVSRATLYRRRDRDAGGEAEQSTRAPHPSALSQAERGRVLAVLHEERFVDRSPAQVVATLLDEEQYLCSERTMYRILASNKEVRERRSQRRHPKYSKPELMATGPCQVWSWDITQLKGPQQGDRFYLFVMLDIFSRFVVGWMLAHKENSQLAERFIQSTVEQSSGPGSALTIHSDRGSPMVAKSTTELLSRLGLERSLSRPRVSNDNPFSESQFKTLKYAPAFPERFGSYEDARSWCRSWFEYYNNEHRHSGLAYFTPASVHHGRAMAQQEQRQRVLDQAAMRHPGRFKRPPVVKGPPPAVWINPPETQQEAEPSEPQAQEVEAKVA